jgi:hypothetical protein
MLWNRGSQWPEWEAAVTIAQLAKILAAALAGRHGAEVEIQIRIRIGGDGQIRSLGAGAKAREAGKEEQHGN